MKKFYVFMMAVLLTLCGVTVMAKLLPAAETVSLLLTNKVETGKSVSTPISLENISTDEPVLPTTDGYAVYIDDQTGWDAITLFMWGDVSSLWPGIQVSGTWDYQGVTWKYFEMGEVNTGLSENLIFNNNGQGSQLKDFAFTINRNVFLRVTANGIEELDILSPSGGTSEIKHDGYVLYILNESSETDLALYAWGDAEAFGGWPGMPATGKVTVNGLEYAYFDLGEANTGLDLHLIPNNNGQGVQWEGDDLEFVIDHDIYVRLANGDKTAYEVMKGFATPTDSGDTPEAKKVTVAEFNAASVDTDTWYEMTGIVKNLKDGDLYGNFDLEDATGSVYVYGLVAEKGGEKKKFQELVDKYGIANGSTITIRANRGEYQGKIEAMNAYFVTESSGGETGPSQMILFSEKDIFGTGSQGPHTYTNGNFVFTGIDNNGKHSIDASRTYFGTTDNIYEFEYRYKPGGTSSSDSYINLSIPSEGVLKIFARSSSNSAYDRNIVLTQNGREIMDQVISPDEAITVEDKTIYPVYETNVSAGSIDITFPNGGVNFHAFEFVPTGGDYSEAYNTLRENIAYAQNILSTIKLTPKGINKLENAIIAATEALATNNDDTMTYAAATLNLVIMDVLTNDVSPSETINFRSSNGGMYSYYGDEWINGQNAKVLLASQNSYSYPETSSSQLYFYNGNTMTVHSEDMPIVAIDFNGSISNSMTTSTGEMKDAKHWTGDTYEVIFTNNTGSQLAVKSITVYFDNPSNEDLIERIASQIETAEKSIAQLAYPNVPGVSGLQALIEEARTLTADADKATLKTALKNLKTQTEGVLALDTEYQSLEAILAAVETTIQNNPNADATYAAEATSRIVEVRAGMADGEYSSADIATITEQMNRYNYILGQVYLTINVTEAGTLGDLILDRTENFTDVKGLRVSGKLNTTDLNRIKSLTNMIELNMAETNVTSLLEYQFQNMTNLEKVVLPSELTEVPKYCFSGCTALTEVTLPETLRIINTYGFYNCRNLAQIEFPEGLQNISSYAFYCDETSTYVNGSYIYKGGSLKEINLPASLTKLGNDAFGNQKDLQKVTFADGLTEIGNQAFYFCIALSDITWPATLTHIGTEAFYNCDALIRVELPEGLTTLNSNAFRNCDKLQEVILPSTLQNINESFYQCNQLTKMTAKGIVPANPNNRSIMSNAANCTLTVPELSIKVYKQANYWSQFNIVGENIMPENIFVTTDYRLTWTEEQSMDYKPNVYVASNAALTVAGNSTLSAANFVLNWRANDARSKSTYDNISGNYYYNRDDCYAALLNNAHVRADNVWINLYTRSNVWDFISLPFDIKVGDIRKMFDEETPLVIRKYDGEKRAQGLTGETWVNMADDNTLQAGQGYIWQSASTEESRNYNGFALDALQTINKNNLFANDDLEIDLAYYESEFEHNRSWNFIGNPYPCYYDIRAMQTTAPITVWNAYNSNYQAYSPQDDAYILNPGQAFFLQRPVDEEKITFRKEGRQIDMTAREEIEFEVTNNARAYGKINNSRLVFNLTLSGNDMTDRTRFVISTAAKMDYESGRDASKFMSFEDNTIEFYTLLGDVRYAINERPLSDGIIELGVRLSENGNYTIALDTKVENEIYLIDRQSGTETRIDGTEGYTFYIDKGTFEGRFAIRIGDGETTGIANINVNENQKFDENMPIYNLNGQRVNVPAKGIYIQNGKKTVVK